MLEGVTRADRWGKAVTGNSCSGQKEEAQGGVYRVQPLCPQPAVSHSSSANSLRIRPTPYVSSWV